MSVSESNIRGTLLNEKLPASCECDSCILARHYAHRVQWVDVEGP